MSLENKHSVALISISILATVLAVALVSVLMVFHRINSTYQSTIATLQAQNKNLADTTTIHSGKQPSLQTQLQHLEETIEISKKTNTLIMKEIEQSWGRPLIQLDRTTVGDTIGPFTVELIEPYFESSTAPLNKKLVLTGTIELSGTYRGNAGFDGHGPTIEIDSTSNNQLPVFMQGDYFFPHGPIFTITNPTDTIRALSVGDNVTVTVDTIYYSLAEGGFMSGIEIIE